MEDTELELGSVSPQVRRAYRDSVLTLPLGYRLLDLAVICITSSGGIHRGADRNHDS
jgi:hypothetical protein